MQDQQHTQEPMPERQIRLRRKALRRMIARKRAFKRPLEEVMIELGQIPVRKCGGLSGAW
jgi:hypothetical protein